MRFAAITLGIWLAVEAALATWICSITPEPTPLGYWGTFYVFSIIAFAAYLVLVIPAFIHYYFQKDTPDTRPGGFPVESETHDPEGDDSKTEPKISN